MVLSGAGKAVLFMSLVYTGSGAPWGFGSRLGNWLAFLQPGEQGLVGVDRGLVAIELAHVIDVEVQHLDEHFAIAEAKFAVFHESVLHE